MEKLDKYYTDKQKRIEEDAPLLDTFYLIMIILIILLLAAAGLKAADYSQTEQLLDAIAQVESGNRDYPPGSNDNGRALGRYQIHRAYWQDGCQYLGVDWPYSDAVDANKARQVVRAYLRRYGKGKTIEQLARLHNGGTTGHKKKSTLKYWVKVKYVLMTNN
jgi:hypothetical protein